MHTPITLAAIEQHLAGKAEHGAYLIDENNKTTCIIFKTTDEETVEISEIFDENKITYVLEKCAVGNKIWIFMGPIEVKKAHR